MKNKSSLKCTGRKFLHKDKTTIAFCSFTLNLVGMGYVTFDTKGVSRCMETDPYDEKIGERIAYKRAKIEALIHFKKIVSDGKIEIEKNLSTCNSSISSLDQEKEVLKERIDKDIVNSDPKRKA